MLRRAGDGGIAGGEPGDVDGARVGRARVGSGRVRLGGVVAARAEEQRQAEESVKPSHPPRSVLQFRRSRRSRGRGGRGAPRRRPRQRAPSAVASRSTSSACTPGSTSGYTFATRPSGPTRKDTREARPSVLETPNAFAQTRIRVGDEREGELLLLGELLVRLPIVAGDAEDLHALLRVPSPRVAERARFGGAARGAVLRVEVDDERVAALRRDALRLAVLVRAGQRGRRGTDRQRPLAAVGALHRPAGEREPDDAGGGGGRENEHVRRVTGRR